MVYIHNGILLSYKKNELMPFAATFMDLPALHAEQLRFPNQTHKEPRFA